MTTQVEEETRKKDDRDRSASVWVRTPTGVFGLVLCSGVGARSSKMEMRYGNVNLAYRILKVCSKF